MHITADFPDAMVPGKTAVIKRLVAASPDFEHRVYSLNRQSGRSGTAMLPSGPGVTAVAYKAPARGLFLRTRLLEVAATILEDIRKSEVQAALLHAHKLTVEGLVVEELAKALGTPYLVSIQGDTDLKILGVRRDLRTRYRTILEGAAGVVSLAPWSRSAIAQTLGFPAPRITLLPCLTETDDMRAAPVIGRPRFVSVFHLMSAARKNLDGLAKAAVLAGRTQPDLHIDVFGGGAPGDVLAAQAMIDAAGAGRHVTLRGPLAADEMQRRLHGYAAFVLPTRRESYGLVHVEALFAGLPIMWSADRGVDGLFNAGVAGHRCHPDDAADIARGLEHLHGAEARLKSAIADHQAKGGFDHLRHAAIKRTYGQLAANAMGQDVLAQDA